VADDDRTAERFAVEDPTEIAESGTRVERQCRCLTVVGDRHARGVSTNAEKVLARCGK